MHNRSRPLGDCRERVAEVKGHCVRWVVGEGTVAQVKEGMGEEQKVSSMKVTESAEALDFLRSSIWTPVFSLSTCRPQEWCLISGGHPDVPFKWSPSDSLRG